MKNCCMSCILWQGMGSAGCSVPGAMLTTFCFILTHDSPSLHRKFLQPHPNIIRLSYIYEKNQRSWGKMMLEYCMAFKKWSYPAWSNEISHSKACINSCSEHLLLVPQAVLSASQVGFGNHGKINIPALVGCGGHSGYTREGNAT